MNGKGDRDRTRNHRAFRQNYSRIRWKRPNPDWRTPKDGEIIAWGVDDKGQFHEFWSAGDKGPVRVYRSGTAG